jgi:aminoglycoside phosphotransferase (APT) family kinase protein
VRPDREQVRAIVEGTWGLPGADITDHHGGMNSATWFVTHGAQRWVAKAVPIPAAELAAALRVAAAVEAAGIPAGAPDRPLADLDGTPLALLRFVPGRPLIEADRAEIGTTLAAVHRALRGVTVAGEQTFHWVDPTAAHLAVRNWIRPAVAEAATSLGAGWTTGLLHTDPAPEAFRAADRIGVIDWSVAMRGPLLYDLASAVMYAGEGVVASYMTGGVLTADEVAAGLSPFVRFRWAVQADYFAHRLVTDDRTGISDPAENEKGLADAERFFAGAVTGRGLPRSGHKPAH